MHGMGSLFIIVGIALVVLGPVGYLLEKRRRSVNGIRRFLIWYCFAWPFAAAILLAAAYPKQHWLYYMQFGIVALGYGTQFLDARRRRAAIRRQAEHPMSGAR